MNYIESMVKTKEKEVEEVASYESARVISILKNKMATKKEPLLRKIIKQEDITDKESGYLTALEEIEVLLEDFLNDY